MTKLYPRRYELLSRDGTVLGVGIVFHKGMGLFWHMAANLGCEWIIGRKHKRFLSAGYSDRVQPTNIVTSPAKEQP